MQFQHIHNSFAPHPRAHTCTRIYAYVNKDTYAHLSSWECFSQVTDMGFMFHSATSFNQDLSSWDVSQVISASPHASHTCLHQIPILGIHNPPCIQHICVTRPSTTLTHTQAPGPHKHVNTCIPTRAHAHVFHLGEYMFYRASSFNQDLIP